ncbi:Fe3+-hydroxamate ABC transporter permease FhuB [Kaistia sp. 32K]|uniref:Fe(3+)-hydroxamate ABC transporter permease FhuB n=1 Tax=Kaistia sp. 32K TaxID=2795690 RepID=UPI001935CA18|nr:Fe(3+)-hydroxamate ABC transporter permease FhuB [Kaistia sp. 32K]BCP55567.1 Fe3+-hydroxamate ABC transporter permease FhuB [Kaistia sp. 32K]
MAIATLLLAFNLRQVLPAGRWLASLGNPTDLQAIIARDALLPRFVMSLLCGGALGLASVVFQQVLRNPLAEPGTLGVFAGAKCALAVAILWAPGLLVAGWDVIAFAGGSLATLIVMLLARRQGFSPAALILSALILSLSLGAFGSMLILVHFDALGELYVWESGSLVQNSWRGVVEILPRLAIALVATLALLRPLALLELDDAGARGLGLSLGTTRALAIAGAVLASAIVAGTIGVIGFVGLAGAAMARFGGARRLSQRLLAGSLIAAGLLACTDQGLMLLSGGMEIPAGAVTPLLGAPLLIYLLRRARPNHAPAALPGLPISTGSNATRIGVALLIALLVGMLAVSLLLGRTTGGWQLASGQDLAALLPWRLPRIVAALSAGLLLAVAGGLLQGLTGNPIASPELLGISSGAGLILLVATFFLPALDRGSMILLSGLAAALVLFAVLNFSRRSAFAPEQLLLTGAALATLLASALSVMLFLGDMRVLRVVGWLSGSTYSVTAGDARTVAVLACLALLLLPLLGRWLEILPLGRPSAAGLGLPIGRSRFCIIAMAAALTGVATLMVGPLSFVGLMAPHMARTLGFRRALPRIYAAALIGGGLMVFADWIGRNIAFPWQIPAGLVATGLGGLYFVLMVARR